ncbi:hypothetical protein G6L37_00450 [Agrobacterium rubi]|nr:hypothetical protein [Agrobacterium rubi]NTF23859.1 hypothetical protein [Agrobacterium rubi]
MTEQVAPEIIVPAEESIESDFLVCMFDGHKTKFLPRYVKSQYGLEWDDYLDYCGLPSEYPRQPPGYAEIKNVMAYLNFGIGPLAP